LFYAGLCLVLKTHLSAMCKLLSREPIRIVLDRNEAKYENEQLPRLVSTVLREAARPAGPYSSPSSWFHRLTMCCPCAHTSACPHLTRNRPPLNPLIICACREICRFNGRGASFISPSPSPNPPAVTANKTTRAKLSAIYLQRRGGGPARGAAVSRPQRPDPAP
jgi:hypothetical protein